MRQGYALTPYYLKHPTGLYSAPCVSVYLLYFPTVQTVPTVTERHATGAHFGYTVSRLRSELTTLFRFVGVF